MTAEEAFAEAERELKQVEAIDVMGKPVFKVCRYCYTRHEHEGICLTNMVRQSEPAPLRILPADEPPKAKIGIGTIIAVSWIGLWAGLRVITFLVGRYL